MPQLSSGDLFGAWTLREFLGEGGNAEVWSASSSDGSTVALKILRSHRAGSEPYLRFRQEIEVLERAAGVRGVLPPLRLRNHAAAAIRCQ